MLRYVFLIAVWLLASLSCAQAQGPQCRTSPVGTSTPNCASESFVTKSVPPPGQLPGTSTNDSAGAGNVGQVINSCVPLGSAVSLTNASPANVTSIAVTAGDWDIEGDVSYSIAATTSVSAFSASISDVSATLPTAPNVTTNFPDGGGLNFVRMPATVFGASSANAYPTGAVRALLSGNTTIYLIAFSNFTVATNKAFGCITARRRR